MATGAESLGGRGAQLTGVGLCFERLFWKGKVESIGNVHFERFWT